MLDLLIKKAKEVGITAEEIEFIYNNKTGYKVDYKTNNSKTEELKNFEKELKTKNYENNRGTTS